MFLYDKAAASAPQLGLPSALVHNVLRGCRCTSRSRRACLYQDRQQSQAAAPVALTDVGDWNLPQYFEGQEPYDILAQVLNFLVVFDKEGASLQRI